MDPCNTERLISFLDDRLKGEEIQTTEERTDVTGFTNTAVCKLNTHIFNSVNTRGLSEKRAHEPLNMWSLGSCCVKEMKSSPQVSLH